MALSHNSYSLIMLISLNKVHCPFFFFNDQEMYDAYNHVHYMRSVLSNYLFRNNDLFESKVGMVRVDMTLKDSRIDVQTPFVNNGLVQNQKTEESICDI